MTSVLGRALTILSCFTPQDSELSLAEICRRTELAKPTVHRLVVELASWGILERTRGGGVRLGIGLFELGQLAPRQRALREAALPFLRDLQEATNETVHLAILEDTEVVYVEIIRGRSAPPLPSRVGGRMPAYCTALGKAMLAFSPASVLEAVVSAGINRMTPHTVVMPGLLQRELAAVRETGVAYERQECTEGIVCAAAPVLDPRGGAVAAISITGRPYRLNPRRVASAVRAAGLGLSREMYGLQEKEVTRH